jgi:tRNA(Ile)-lysidine synthetase-like protein
MQLNVKPGKYVVAVSGGVDSLVLLDVLHRQLGLELVIAHFEHGIRDESDNDRQLVGRIAASYGLPYVYEHGNLGALASEATARFARYNFLHKVRHDVGAQAIITAHHQDDLLETAILNLMRGTGRRGLSSLRSGQQIVRPLLGTSKRDILAYAHAHAIEWHEDSTNKDDKYARNYIRHHIVPNLGDTGRRQLLSYIAAAQKSNLEIDTGLRRLLVKHTDNGRLNRQWLIMQDHAFACELVGIWLRACRVGEFDRKTVERLVVGAKVLRPLKSVDVAGGYVMTIGQADLSICRFSS